MTSAFQVHRDRLVDLALEEDVGPGDVTTAALVEPEARGRGRIVAREALTVSGLGVAEAVFHRLDPRLGVNPRASDGEAVVAGTTVLELDGHLASILTGERTALNFLQRLSGIATLTRRYVDALAGSKTRLLDTRKTTPGWRALEKAAVRHGGGHNHRFALFDGVLIKDNHIAAVGSIRAAVARARAAAPVLLEIEVEVEDLSGLDAAIDAGADVVLLDNMDDETLRAAVARAAGRVRLEASGGITLERLPRLADIGVDYVSCGAVTHGATAVDLALDLDG
jgi:nicotinate-nucleotide pyrophosphorylase (carboxylating)